MALSIKNAGGIQLCLLEDDERATAMLEAGGSFNPSSDLIWRRLRRSADWTVIVDVGANYGEMILSEPLESGIQAYAFEPNPRIADCLRHSVAEANYDITVIESAVGDRTGPITFYVDARWSGTSTATAANAPEDAEYISVDMVRLDHFLLTEGLIRPAHLLCKIDVEGGERAVLEGLLPVLPLFEQYLVQVEILHTPDNDLDWMLKNFVLHLAVPDARRLVPVATIDDYRRLMNSGRFYPQDAVLAPRPQLSYLDFRA